MAQTSFVLAYRAYVTRTCRRLLAADQASYDAAWGAVLESPGGLDKLVDLATALAATGVTGAEPPHQLVPFPTFNSLTRKPPGNHLTIEVNPPSGGPGYISATICLSSSWSPAAVMGPEQESQSQQVSEVSSACLHPSSSCHASSLSRSRPGGPDQGAARLMDLDVLYFQAMCAHPLLVEKVRCWAAACKGQFPGVRSRMGGGVLLFSPPAEELSDAIRWARVKTVARSIEKVRRCYDQDVSRLVDVCRQAIIFDDIADITACVTLIASDSDVHLLRAKNRLSCSAAASGGYRDVLLNLCVITGAAQEMGVDRHVCEVQLILRSFFLLKSEDGHRRYVLFRNLQSE